MAPLIAWLERLGTAGAARNAGAVLAERRRMERTVDAVAQRVGLVDAGAETDRAA